MQYAKTILEGELGISGKFRWRALLINRARQTLEAGTCPSALLGGDIYTRPSEVFRVRVTKSPLQLKRTLGSVFRSKCRVLALIREGLESEMPRALIAFHTSASPSIQIVVSRADELATSPWWLK